MGKRSDFVRVERDFYRTPKEAFLPLLPFLPDRPFTFIEPCFGDGALSRHIENNSSGVMVQGIDIEPQIKHDNVITASALDVDDSILQMGELIITNPPWDRSSKSGHLMHRMIERFSDNKPTWLLFDSDWLWTKQAGPYMDRLVCTVAVGRVKWIEGSSMTGKDNCQWALFDTRARTICKAPYIFGKEKRPYDGFVNEMYEKLC